MLPKDRTAQPARNDGHPRYEWKIRKLAVSIRGRIYGKAAQYDVKLDDL
jgi:hypothetical protein